MARISFRTLSCRVGGGGWTWHRASRCCWNRVSPWHASELVSFLVWLRTYQHAGTINHGLICLFIHSLFFVNGFLLIIPQYCKFLFLLHSVCFPFCNCFFNIHSIINITCLVFRRIISFQLLMLSLFCFQVLLTFLCAILHAVCAAPVIDPRPVEYALNLLLYDMAVSCHTPFLPGTSLEPAVIPTAHASSFTLQHFPYYVWCSECSCLL